MTMTSVATGSTSSDGLGPRRHARRDERHRREHVQHERREQHHQPDGDDELGQRRDGQRDHREDVVEPAVAARRREHAQADADERADDAGEQHEHEPSWRCGAPTSSAHGIAVGERRRRGPPGARRRSSPSTARRPAGRGAAAASSAATRSGVACCPSTAYAALPGSTCVAAKITMETRKSVSTPSARRRPTRAQRSGAPSGPRLGSRARPPLWPLVLIPPCIPSSPGQLSQ